MLLGFETQTPGRELLGAQLQDSGMEKCNCFQVLEVLETGGFMGLTSFAKAGPLSGPPLVFSSCTS